MGERLTNQDPCTMIFRVSKNVRFSHCDPAGIVFYPRYAELCNEVVEDWFRDALGISFRALQEEHRLTIPAVKLEIEYLVPSVYGDMLEFTLSVEAMGNSSVQLAVSAWNGEEERVRIRLKIVMVSLENLRPIRIDEEWRERFSQFMR
ncbi:thioesterase superfamily protein [Thiorhodococcus drewsii AZ1]|uniref:Thioesterase superfamily protein n=1 Tax=Thiorhodococcus drewsii AZ1 TaxID=765913 RepID=G2E4R7_9GAMM|nr:thioesterase family protein [Thiorhodococcus drewsii]EGV29543.1 thioesterase superfamily protein [Thiorhodococcus drewsii AZ1]